MKPSRLLLVIGAIAAIIIAYFLLRKNSPSSEKSADLIVAVTEAPMTVSIHAPGELQARRSEKIKGPDGLRTASLIGQFGLTQTGAQLDQVYTNLLDQEVVTLSFTVPIVDWGKSKARRAVAQSSFELEQRQVGQERENFRRIVMLRAQQFELVRRNTEIAEKSLEAARKRYEITYQRYLIGKISVTDLNLALADQESARRGYLQSVRDFWMALFEIRGMTLYDFVEDRTLMLATPEIN